ncbi:hypothetical protein M0802_001258 [Mischocyttarus mexicanus]|nr:hypothetical protein M0802_001258 [Mischocyttarus mexicanus]
MVKLAKQTIVDHLVVHPDIRLASDLIKTLFYNDSRDEKATIVKLKWKQRVMVGGGSGDAGDASGDDGGGARTCSSESVQERNNIGAQEETEQQR